MLSSRIQSLRHALVLCCLTVSIQGAFATTLRVVTWNVDADTSFNPDGIPNAAASQTVFAAMGSYALAGHAQAPDVISLQELHATTTVNGVNSNVTLSNLVTDLNTVFGANTYAYDATTAPSNGGQGTVGNGPSGLIYNTHTVAINSVTTVGTIAADNLSRTPLRYNLQAVGVNGGLGQFYLYDEHYKALGDSTSAGRRTQEADLIRSNADKLGPTAHILFTGDYNFDLGSTEQAYQDLTAPAGTLLANPQYGIAGTGRAYDPLVSSFKSSQKPLVQYYTDSAKVVTSRLDFQLISAAVQSGSGVDGLQLVPNTEVAFGNSYYNGSTLLSTVTEGNSVDLATNTGPGLSQNVLTALTTVTDHLPLVADYTIVPEPAMMTAFVLVAGVLLHRRRPV